MTAGNNNGAAPQPLEFGIVGLGNIGGNLALQALAKNMRVLGHDRRAPPPELTQAGLEFAERPEVFRERLASPRRVFLYVPAGQAVDVVLAELLHVLEPGDILVDGGNSYWGDSLQRHRQVAAAGLRFVDMGTSGGLDGARHGACFMTGGERDTVAQIEPILLQLAVPGGYVHAGPPGAGHFTKLVHNGIEFGMLQAIGEGVDLLERHGSTLPVADILEAWRHGSVIRSWLIDLMAAQYRTRSLDEVPGYVEDTGEVNWLIDDALRMEVPIPVISQAVMQLFASRDDRRNWARAIAMMRHGFGNHPFGPEPRFAAQRRGSRLTVFKPAS